MKVALVGDIHYISSDYEKMKTLFEKIAKEGADLVCLVGDFNGYKPVDDTDYNTLALEGVLAILRTVMPNIKVISVLGNHDYWQLNNNWHKFDKSHIELVKIFKNFDIHFLNLDGVYRDKNFPKTAFVGHTGWYSSSL
jgi:predicted MPP superfamily phosphohydrolase